MLALLSIIWILLSIRGPLGFRRADARCFGPLRAGKRGRTLHSGARSKCAKKWKIMSICPRGSNCILRSLAPSKKTNNVNLVSCFIDQWKSNVNFSPRLHLCSAIFCSFKTWQHNVTLPPRIELYSAISCNFKHLWKIMSHVPPRIQLYSAISCTFKNWKKHDNLFPRIQPYSAISCTFKAWTK